MSGILAPAEKFFKQPEKGCLLEPTLEEIRHEDQ